MRAWDGGVSQVSDESCTVAQLQTCADHAFECRQRELGVLALEMSLGKLMHATPRHHSEIAAVLRQLMHRSASRHAAWQYMQTALRLLEGYSAANAPFATDELQWLLAESWNRGCAVRNAVTHTAMRHTPHDTIPYPQRPLTNARAAPSRLPWSNMLTLLYSTRLATRRPSARPSSRMRRVGWPRPSSSRATRARSPLGGRSSTRATRHAHSRAPPCSLPW